MLLAICCAAICIVYEARQGEDYVLAAAVGIRDITEKFQEGESFFLTVELDGFYEWDESVTLKVGESIYREVDLEDDFIGISIIMTLPGEEAPAYLRDQPPMDFQTILKSGFTDACEITGITKSGNEKIG